MGSTTIAAAGVICLAAVLSGCTGQPTEAPGPSGSDGPAGTSTFADLGIDDWPAEIDLAAGAPETPDGIDEGRYDELVAGIAGFAEAGAVDADLRELDDPLPELAARIGDPFARAIPFVAESETAPRVSVMNYLGDGVDLVGGPVMQHVWNVAPDADAVVITLQTWTAYEVETDAGPAVLGVFRQFARTEGSNGSVQASWVSSGADVCALAVEDAMVPDSDPERQEELIDFASEGGRHEYEVREIGDTIDEDLKRSCQDAG